MNNNYKLLAYQQQHNDNSLSLVQKMVPPGRQHHHQQQQRATQHPPKTEKPFIIDPHQLNDPSQNIDPAFFSAAKPQQRSISLTIQTGPTQR